MAKGLQGRRLSNSKNVNVRDGTDADISFEYDAPGDAVLVQVELNRGGQTFHRSIIAETRLPPPL